MAQEVTIVRVSKFASADPARAGKMDTVVFYLIDKSRPGRVTLPKEDPTESEILDAIRKQEKSIHPATGKSFPL